MVASFVISMQRIQYVLPSLACFLRIVNHLVLVFTPRFSVPNSSPTMSKDHSTSSPTSGAPVVQSAEATNPNPHPLPSPADMLALGFGVLQFEVIRLYHHNTLWQNYF